MRKPAITGDLFTAASCLQGRHVRLSRGTHPDKSCPITALYRVSTVVATLYCGSGVPGSTPIQSQYVFMDISFSYFLFTAAVTWFHSRSRQQLRSLFAFDDAATASALRGMPNFYRFAWNGLVSVFHIFLRKTQKTSFFHAFRNFVKTCISNQAHASPRMRRRTRPLPARVPAMSITPPALSRGVEAATFRRLQANSCPNYIYTASCEYCPHCPLTNELNSQFPTHLHEQ